MSLLNRNFRQFNYYYFYNYLYLRSRLVDFIRQLFLGDLFKSAVNYS